ncbi:unnamed protein product [Vitrella brassicaformis CCMP3155]|uniref:Uncharacterized protein n=1 Tax=Vitrella brassicaformis (strain CCMP3155) TaxID=1169540 RepID=A0A0G4G093_VITBC|nr:unnamed protein product [Vitrella brassicaformis CCMP3155]|mmetsp:Transcript_14257/g.33964  ORF Transcript_14257/g.33964 Transcript_14257/m.33964 type:complete len:217 (-) Transcript_14257:232-882(-)|eukprot:CEM21270.1 unnamed protein product [Vitrella brassicaformis CCMP3155]
MPALLESDDIYPPEKPGFIDVALFVGKRGDVESGDKVVWRPVRRSDVYRLPLSKTHAKYRDGMPYEEQRVLVEASKDRFRNALGISPGVPFLILDLSSSAIGVRPDAIQQHGVYLINLEEDDFNKYMSARREADSVLSSKVPATQERQPSIARQRGAATSRARVPALGSWLQQLVRRVTPNRVRQTDDQLTQPLLTCGEPDGARCVPRRLPSRPAN